MDNNFSVKENVEALFNQLEKFLKTETVIGEPIVVGETTLVPIISVMFGCGTGSGTGGDGKGADGTGSGLGAGARIAPNAILVIKKDEVSMLPVKSKSNLEGLVKMVPEIISKIDIKKYTEKCDKKEAAEESKED
ncbi:MAG: spore germination protein GerW family protein [Bacillota bacterium]|nr:spore germination protein GerW family protein [Bacillota bacterium]